jgi:hypothetical protein
MRNSECWDTHSACMEYDLYLKEPHDPTRAYRIMVFPQIQPKLAMIVKGFFIRPKLLILIQKSMNDKYNNQPGDLEKSQNITIFLDCCLQ